MSFFKFLSMAVLISMVAVISSCSDDDEQVTAPLTETANVRVIHTSYDAPNVDVQVDDAVAITDLAYGASSGYATLTAGTRNIKVTPTGQSSTVVIEADLTLEAGNEYTVYAVDEVANIGAVVSVDAREENSSKAKVRLIHTAPDAPAVDIKLNSGTGPAVFTNVPFKQFTDYIEVDEGSYTFVVTPAGGTAEVVVFDPIAVQNGMVYTVVAHGTLDAADNFPFAVRVFIDNETGNTFADLTTDARANVQVIHASPDAPGVDLLVDDTIVNSSALEFPNSTGYLQVNPGTRNVKVNASGTTTTVIEADLILAANKSYSVFAVDFLSNIAPLVLEDDLSAPAAGKSHVRFVHLSPDAPAVDITLTDGTVVFGNKAFKESTDFTPLDAGTYDLQVRVAGTATVALELPGIALEQGRIYTVFAKGSLNNVNNQSLGAEIIVE